MHVCVAGAAKKLWDDPLAKAKRREANKTVADLPAERRQHDFQDLRRWQADQWFQQAPLAKALGDYLFSQRWASGGADFVG
eukprot:10547812-Alexandrium_andersonii.AAC.1